jgi:MFS family permease
VIRRSGTRPQRAPTFRSFSSRNFRLFFAGQLLSTIGNWLTTIAATLFVLHLTDSAIAVGVLTACQFAPMLLFGLWAGVVVDRVDKRKLLVVTQVVAACQSAAFAFLAFSGDPPLAAIYGIALVGGFVVSIDTTARRAFVVEMVDEDMVVNAVSLNSALMTSGRVIGPVVAGVLIALVGYG